MANPPSYDHDLLARLNALKQSSITLEPQKPSLGIAKEPLSHEDALTARLKSLRSGSPAGTSSSRLPVESDVPSRSPQPSPLDGGEPGVTFSSPDLAEDGGLPGILSTHVTSGNFGRPGAIYGGSSKSGIDQPGSRSQEVRGLSDEPPKRLEERADELMALLEQENSLSASQQNKGENAGDEEAASNASGSNITPAQDLQSRADALLKRMKLHQVQRTESSHKEEASDGDSDTDVEAEAREAEELLAQIMDEAQYEQAQEAKANAEAEAARAAMPPPPKPPTLPIAPSEVQEPPDLADQDQAQTPSRRSIDFSSSLAARMAALTAPTHIPEATSPFLNLPSAPKTALSHKRATPPPPPEEPADWCTICYDNSTLICLDCDADGGPTYYCARCWKEGHTGPDAGWEERGHKWEKYRRERR